MNIEDTKPIDVLASRIWSGTHWHYPHIEKMVAELAALRARVGVLDGALREHLEFYDNLIANSHPDDEKLRTLWRGLHGPRMERSRAALTPPPTKEASGLCSAHQTPSPSCHICYPKEAP